MDKAECGTFEWIVKEELTDTGHDSEEKEDEESQEDEHKDMQSRKQSGKRNMEVKIKQSQTRSTFLTWLRTGNHVFHISGKAGSGKSTLMKLLLDHPRTREELNHWAADKQLIFAHFFFWRSGDKMQRSLEGLYRSILFETLNQCPNLIEEVFREAYTTFSKERQENCIDELLFRPEDFRKGLQRLISKTPNPGYRFCFFIDGLDEYGEDGADRLHHEELAKSLELWAGKDDIKILVSSRPHREFQSAFSDDLRIKLHDLTKPDISRFGRQMFKNDKNFFRVQHCYKDLVNKVVQQSNGVFLWARLAIRSLLMAVRRHEAIDSLEKQLDNIPKDVNELYEKLLASISPSDRVKTFKMLLLAYNVGSLTAVALTWIDKLDDPKFPTSHNMQPCTDDEIKERQLVTEFQLDYFTKGLLEIATHVVLEDEQNLFLRKRVQFFHRTVRDFVRESKQLREFSVEFPGFMSSETTARILLADLWFAKTEYVTFGMLNGSLHSCCAAGESRDTWLDAYERVFNYHCKAENPNMRGMTTSPGSNWVRSEDGTQRSFLHWLTWSFSDSDYVLYKLSKTPHLLHSNDDLSLLLSAALSWEDTPALKEFLGLGASPNEQVKINQVEYHTSTTVWKAFCVCLAACLISDDIGGYRSLYLRRLADFLATREVDTNCFVLLALGKDPRDYEGDPTHVIFFGDLVQQLDLPNWKTLSRLMNHPGLGIFTALRGACRYLTTSKSDQPFRPDKYLPFTLNMQPPTVDEPGSGDSYFKYGFFVHSVRWEDDQLMAPSLKVRVF